MSKDMIKQVAGTRSAFIFFIGIALLPGIGASVAAVALIQQRYLPIVEEFQISELLYDHKNDVIISGSFRKIYPDWACKYQDMNWYMPVFTELDGSEIRLRISADYADRRPNESNNNRHKGPNAFYGWTIGVSEYPELNQFTGYVKHKCLGFIYTITNFPVFNMKTYEHVPY